MLALPYDVLDSLVSDPLISKADLKSLSLVCKGFVQPCQQRLYEHVSPTQGDKCAQLYDTLSASPHISTYIKHLEIESDFHNQHLPGVVKKAGEVQSVMLGTPQVYSIPGPGRPTQQTIWAHMPHEFIEAIEHILQLPSLTSLSLNHWTFPSHHTLANLLCLPTNQLDSLTLYTTIFDPSKRSAFPPRDDDTHTLKTIEMPTKKPVSPLHLAVAMKGGDPDLLEHIFVESQSDSILDLSRTTSFTFAGTSMQEEELAEAVVRVGARAHTLQISSLSVLPGDEDPSVSFRANTSVSCLTIDYSNGGYAAGLSGNPLQHISACLATFEPTKNDIRHICLKMGPICVAMARERYKWPEEPASQSPQRGYEVLHKEGVELVGLADILTRTFPKLSLFEFLIMGQDNERKATDLRNDIEEVLRGRWERAADREWVGGVELRVEVVEPAWQFF